MKEDIEELRANVERTEMAGLTFIATRAACARAALDYIAQLEQAGRAQRTTFTEGNSAAGQAGLAKLQRYVYDYNYGDPKIFAQWNGEWVKFADVEALFAPVAADTEQARPVEPGALAASIAEMEAWLETDGCEPLTVSQGESVGLILHELKRLRAVCPECKGSGMADSGGTHPWGEPALIRCGCTPLATPADAGAGQKLTNEAIVDLMLLADKGAFNVPVGVLINGGRVIEAEVLARMSTPAAQVTASDAGGKANAECLLEEVAQLRQVIAGFAGGARQAASGDEVEMFLRWCDQVKLPIDAPDGSFSMRAFRWAKVAWLYRAALDNHSEELLDMAGQSPAPVTATDLLNELHRLFRTREWTDREGDWDDALVAVCEEIAKRIQVARGAVSAAPVTAEPAQSIDTPELRDLIGDVYRAGAHNESLEKSENALIRHIATHSAPADRDAIRADYKPVGKFLYVGMAYEATSSDDPRGITLYRAADAAETRDAKGGE